MTREQAKTILDLMLTTAHTTLCEMEKDAIRTIIELVNEQEAYISRVSNEYLALVGKASKQPIVIRCKDCKYFNDYFVECEKNDHTHGADWYCADGQRKD